MYKVADKEYFNENLGAAFRQKSRRDGLFMGGRLEWHNSCGRWLRQTYQTTVVLSSDRVCYFVYVYVLYKLMKNNCLHIWKCSCTLKKNKISWCTWYTGWSWNAFAGSVKNLCGCGWISEYDPRKPMPQPVPIAMATRTLIDRMTRSINSRTPFKGWDWASPSATLCSIGAILMPCSLWCHLSIKRRIFCTDSEVHCDIHLGVASVGQQACLKNS